MQRAGKALRTGEACEPFRQHLVTERERSPVPASWKQVEAGFLEAMAAFDRSVFAGDATEGERQNGKGDYFNDLLALLLEAASGKLLTTRRKVSGLIFPNHNLDVTYPTEGIAEVLVEAKMLGTPKHKGSPQQKDQGRPGQADMLKRAKELGFKAIDLKAGFGLELARTGGSQAGPVGDLATWSRSSLPRTYFLMAVRVTGEADLRACIETATNIAKLVDGVGLFAYTNDHLDRAPDWYAPAAYRNLKIQSGIALEPMLYAIGNILGSLPGAAAPGQQDPEVDVLPLAVVPPVS